MLSFEDCRQAPAVEHGGGELPVTLRSGVEDSGLETTMFSDFRNVLVLAPHTDDGELGAGGTIARLIETGARVSYAAFSTAESSLPPGFSPDTLVKEVKASTARLGIRESDLFIYRHKVRELEYVRQEVLDEMILLRRNKYDLIMLPSQVDIHQDHEVVAREGLRAFKHTTILGYELNWNNLRFSTVGFVRLEERHLHKKCDALAAYESQAEKAYMKDSFTYAMARARGVQIGVEYAECFEVIRWIM